MDTSSIENCIVCKALADEPVSIDGSQEFIATYEARYGVTVSEEERKLILAALAQGCPKISEIRTQTESGGSREINQTDSRATGGSADGLAMRNLMARNSNGDWEVLPKSKVRKEAVTLKQLGCWPVLSALAARFK